MGKKRNGFRYQTYFGVSIPVFKEEKYNSNSTTIRFVITGNIPSKKNNQQAVTIRKFARDFVNKLHKSNTPPTYESMHKAISMTSSKMRGNVKYIEFLKTIKPEIQNQMAWWSERLKEKGLIFPIEKATLSLRFYFKDRYVRDTVNLQQTVQDLLVDCGVISDDDYDTLNPINSKSACYYEEIVKNIATITLTTNLQRSCNNDTV